jgi:hypothetical protein
MLGNRPSRTRCCPPRGNANTCLCRGGCRGNDAEGVHHGNRGRIHFWRTLIGGLPGDGVVVVHLPITPPRLLPLEGARGRGRGPQQPNWGVVHTTTGCRDPVSPPALKPLCHNRARAEGGRAATEGSRPPPGRAHPSQRLQHGQGQGCVCLLSTPPNALNGHWVWSGWRGGWGPGAPSRRLQPIFSTFTRGGGDPRGTARPPARL